MKILKTFLIAFIGIMAIVLVIALANFIVVTLSQLVIKTFPNFGSTFVGVVLVCGFLAGCVAIGANDKVG